eukprot:3238088-Ditylum_brightwellii.AAC.1
MENPTPAVCCAHQIIVKAESLISSLHLMYFIITSTCMAKCSPLKCISPIPKFLVGPNTIALFVFLLYPKFGSNLGSSIESNVFSSFLINDVAGNE